MCGMRRQNIATLLLVQCPSSISCSIVTCHNNIRLTSVFTATSFVLTGLNNNSNSNDITDLPASLHGAALKNAVVGMSGSSRVTVQWVVLKKSQKVNSR